MTGGRWFIEGRVLLEMTQPAVHQRHSPAVTPLGCVV